MEDSRVLLEAAAGTGVEKIVHFSVANASPDSDLPYFRGKGQVEELLKPACVSYAIIRPTLVFGAGDLLLNNMAWALRRFPVFPVFGNGNYKVHPIFAEDPCRPRRWGLVPALRASLPTRRAGDVLL